MSRNCHKPGLNITFELTNQVDDTTKKHRLLNGANHQSSAR